MQQHLNFINTVNVCFFFALNPDSHSNPVTEQLLATRGLFQQSASHKVISSSRCNPWRKFPRPQWAESVHSTICGRMQQTRKQESARPPATLPSAVTSRGRQWIHTLLSPSVGQSVSFILLPAAAAHFPAEEKYLQPVESMRQESVHRS